MPSELGQVEQVHTVRDFYDGPRSGIANFRGRLHFYECLFDDSRDEYADQFLLFGADEQARDLECQVIELFNKLLAAVREKRITPLDFDRFHPVLPEDRELYESAAKKLDTLLPTSTTAPSYVAAGMFAPVQCVQVAWSPMPQRTVRWHVTTTVAEAMARYRSLST